MIVFSRLRRAYISLSLIQADRFLRARILVPFSVVSLLAVGSPALALTEPVGTASSTQSLTVTVATAGTVGSIAVLTQGAANKDFQYVTGGTCAVGATYAVNATCTVEYTFTPSRPGQRLAAVVLESNASPAVPMSTTLLAATGTGPLVTFPGSTTEATLGANNYPEGVVVDGAGDVFFTNTQDLHVTEFVAGTGGNASGVVSSNSTQLTIATTAGDISLAMDGAGDLFVGGGTNNKVTEILAGTNGNAAGVVSSTSATVSVGSTNGSFSNPFGVAVDSAGDVFVADYSNNAVKEIVAGTGGNPREVVSAASTVVTVNSTFTTPIGVAVDVAGDVFVTDKTNSLKEIEAGTGGNAAGVVSSSSTVVTIATGFSTPYLIAPTPAL